MKIKNDLATYHKLKHAKIIERTPSHSGFSNYVVNIMIDRYSYECILYLCHTKSNQIKNQIKIFISINNDDNNRNSTYKRNIVNVYA